MPSKRYKKLPEKTKDLNADLIEKLLPEVKKNCTTKFDESLDLSFQINNKQKKSEVNIRTVVNLPERDFLQALIIAFAFIMQSRQIQSLFA